MPRRRLQLHRPAAVVVALVAATGAAAGALGPVGSGATVSERAVRVPVERPVVDGPIRTVAFIGDSLVADYREIIPTPPEYTNEVVPLVRAQLDLRLGRGGVDVWNHAVAGMAVKHPLARFTPNNLRAELSVRYASSGALRPDLVVISVSHLDLANVDRPIELLAPELAWELAQAVSELQALGIEALIVPATPVSEAMFGYFRPAVDGLPGRIRYLNATLAASGLPVLPDPADRFDDDGDGVPDPRFYVDYHHHLPDDGLHLNRVGQYAFAGAIGPWLADVIQTANVGARS